MAYSRISFTFTFILDFLTTECWPIVCPEMSVRNYHCTLCNVPEEGRSHLLHGTILKSHINLYTVVTDVSCLFPNHVSYNSSRNLPSSCPYEPQLLEFTRLWTDSSGVRFPSPGDRDRTLRYTCQQNQLIRHPISQFFQRNALSVITFGVRSGYIHQV